MIAFFPTEGLSLESPL